MYKYVTLLTVYKYYNTERAVFVNKGRDGRWGKQASEDTEIPLGDWCSPGLKG